MNSVPSQLQRMVSKVVLDALIRAEDLKDKCNSASNQNLSIESWVLQQQLLKLYKEVLITDLEYALDKKVEQELWNNCFKNHIVTLQNISKVRKDTSGLSQARLAWFLDSASGFYLTLLQEFCSLYGLDLPFKRNDSLYGCRFDIKEKNLHNHPERSSCFYICQHCLVHLGDLARYRNQLVQAESFYRHAASLCANSGHPYNQLALLEASRSEKLSTVFYYTRSIAVAHKFPVALTNLANTLKKITSVVKPIEDKISPSDYEHMFLLLHSYIYLNQNLEEAEYVLKAITHALIPLVATQELSTWKLLQMSVITIFVYNYLEGNVEDGRKVLSEFLVGFLNALLLPLYTMSVEVVLDYFALPAIKVLLCWFKCEPSVCVGLNGQHLWRGLCKLFNTLLTSKPDISQEYKNHAITEDYDLRGFLPLEPELSSLKFGAEELDSEVIKHLRALRLISLGEWLAQHSESKFISLNENGQFEAAGAPAAIQIDSPPSKSSQGLSQEPIKGRSRQNVALQSIFRRSQAQVAQYHPGSDVNLAEGMWAEDKFSSYNQWMQQGAATDGFWSGSSGNTQQEGTYSLFSGGSELHGGNSANSSIPLINNSQSLWSGPGPSPLERLLEQQKQSRSSQLPNS